jgi:hypothetical protein
MVRSGTLSKAKDRQWFCVHCACAIGSNATSLEQYKYEYYQ